MMYASLLSQRKTVKDNLRLRQHFKAFNVTIIMLQSLNVAHSS